MFEVVNNPVIARGSFDPRDRKPGLSAILRLRNEAEFLTLVLESLLPHFDELVIVYNNCQDQTPEIVAEFEQREPQRVRAFHYVPEVFPQGSAQHKVLPPEHPSSLVHYYNFALSKTSYRVATKWDGDMIPVPDALASVVRQLRSPSRWEWLRRRGRSLLGRADLWWFSGVNLWDSQGELKVLKATPRCNLGDMGFWGVTERNVFRHDPRYEVLDTTGLRSRFVGWLFYHLKCVKADRGLGNYRLDENPDSRYHEQVERFWTEPELITLDEYRAIEPGVRSFPSPESLGIVAPTR